jgi:hypothetical protein
MGIGIKTRKSPLPEGGLFLGVGWGGGYYKGKSNQTIRNLIIVPGIAFFLGNNSPLMDEAVKVGMYLLNEWFGRLIYTQHIDGETWNFIKCDIHCQPNNLLDCKLVFLRGDQVGLSRFRGQFRTIANNDSLATKRKEIAGLPFLCSGASSLDSSKLSLTGQSNQSTIQNRAES